jgi:hypothetical protein
MVAFTGMRTHHFELRQAHMAAVGITLCFFME